MAVPSLEVRGPSREGEGRPPGGVPGVDGTVGRISQWERMPGGGGEAEAGAERDGGDGDVGHHGDGGPGDGGEGWETWTSAWV